ncbi:MAG: ABC transporter ATP-binding protein [Gammaproteobacteria bacterium RIFCSPHIGHO2_12_FULL_42_10]|nr:MAG: ABC transporter ATP-binding protein [Gammaproteobacteria bacterium RIFCSPHIGHO2_12_FULL_42_10]
MSRNLVEINKMSYSHENGRLVFQDIDMVIQQGKITAIMGPSGVGKTTLLRLIGGQLIPTHGVIKVADEIIHTLSRKALYQLRQRFGMLFQAGGLFTHLSVYENVAFPLHEHTVLSNDMIHSLVMMKLQMVGLRGVAQLMPGVLSGGMARRVALARAIVLDPELILYDEPFTGQDPISLGVLVRLIKTLNDDLGLTSVIVSHDVTKTMSIADDVYVIADSRIIAHGTPTEIARDRSAKLQQFIQGLPDGPVPFDYPACAIAEDLLGE